MSDEIEKYFVQYGQLNYMEIHQENSEFYGLIEFKATQVAKTILSIEAHYINGDYKVEVQEAEPWYQPDHILNALDNDCLQMILSNLNQLDLTSAANVCTRFNEQAKAVFSSKFKKLDLARFSNDEAKIALQTFGSLIRSIDINSFHRFEMEILIMIIKFCKKCVLKELKITDFLFKNKMHNGIDIDTALTKLEKLSLNFCFLKKSAMNFLALCTELKILHLNNCSFYDDIHLPKFNQLDELRVDGGVGIGNLHLNGFIASHPTLRKLSLAQVGYPSVCASKTMLTIAQNLPNLLELEVNMNTINRTEFAASLFCLGTLTSLKVLKLNLNSQPVANLNVLIQKTIPIEHLRLSNGTIGIVTAETISKMTKLKVLELCDIDGLTDGNLIELAKGLGNRLERLQLEESTAANLSAIGLKKMLAYTTQLSFLSLKSTTIGIGTDDYKTMISTLRKRPNNIRLLIELSGYGDQVEISEQISMENCDLLQIIENFAVDSYSSSQYYYNDDTDSSIDLFDYDDYVYYIPDIY